MDNRSREQRSIDHALVVIPGEQLIRASANRYCTTQESTFDLHYPLELGVVLSGRMLRYYRGWQTEAAPGEVWWCGVWEPHGFAVPEAPCDVVVVTIAPEILVHSHLEETRQFDWWAPFTMPPEKRPQTSSCRRAAALDVGRRLAAASSDLGPRQPLWLTLLSLELVLTVAESWTDDAPSLAATSSAYACITQAVQIVYHTKRLLTVQEVARACNMGRNHFARLFRQVMGISFPAFALRHRLAGAALQLLSSELAVKQIAYEWGFADASHLCHLFQEHYACSPAEYRARSRSRLTDE